MTRPEIERKFNEMYRLIKEYRDELHSFKVETAAKFGISETRLNDFHNEIQEFHDSIDFSLFPPEPPVSAKSS
jgi:hypothetical protein